MTVHVHWKRGKNVGMTSMTQISCYDADVCGQGETSLGVHSKGENDDCTDSFEASPDSIRSPSVETPRALCCKASALSFVSATYTTWITPLVVIILVMEQQEALTKDGVAHAKLASTHRVSL